MQQSPLWFGHMVHKDAPNTLGVFGGCGHGKSTLPEHRPRPRVAFGQSDRPTLDVSVCPGGLGLAQGGTAMRVHHQHTAPLGRLGQQIMRARRILPSPALGARRNTLRTGQLGWRYFFGRTGASRQKYCAGDGQVHADCGCPRTGREMGVWHIENSNNPPIYQLFSVAVPVLSLAGVCFLDRQRHRAAEKKPTALPRWVLCLLKLNWLAPAGN